MSVPASLPPSPNAFSVDPQIPAEISMSMREPLKMSHPPRRLPWHCAPEEAAARLAHLPGFCWLDTPGGSGDGISILTALPEREYRGSLQDARDLAMLERALADLRENTTLGLPADWLQWDWGFPVSGLFGNVDYDGRFHFATCQHLLIYRHASNEWWECGELSQHLAPIEKCPAAENIRLHFQPELSREAFLAAVTKAQAYIAAGDIYQVNLSHRFRAPWPMDKQPLDFYLQLREASPAPNAAYLSLPEGEIFCSSPESFLHLSGNSIRTRPIKGTRPRLEDPAEDYASSLDLLTSEKERSELLMITDLLRNDLGSVCQYGSVHVPELLRLETFPQVFHLVSTVQGTLRPEISHIAALQACFPGGSITGAPKKRAREIIAELEHSPRGPYCGAIGYFGSNGESQFNIAIRTVIRDGEHVHFHVGAGIVADSLPAAEWQETWHKAKGILAAAGSM